jgi:hypothetical protein
MYVADSTTQAPTFTAPAAGATVTGGFALDFTLPEAALAGSVTLTITHESGTADSADPRIITFGSPFETGANHAMDVAELSSADSSADIVSIVPATDLVHGAVYAFELSYQDASSNAAHPVAHAAVTVGEWWHGGAFRLPERGRVGVRAPG